MQSCVHIIRWVDAEGQQEQSQHSSYDKVVALLEGVAEQVYGMHVDILLLQLSDDTAGNIRPGGGLARMSVGKDDNGFYWV